ncbi:MAG: hypothetical protein PHC41_03700 [Lachnospiraceae bacterium]|nr:hypothetical protein [Lachnospiraceae bacterium]MDD3615312.1 hypothetical protein [Lachnospiraceae bacterium]
MNRRDKKPGKRFILLTAAALVMILSLSVGSALAYFTTYATAAGDAVLELGFTETIPNEVVERDGKHITIENIGDYACFVRVQVFAENDVIYHPAANWRDGKDGFWYYDLVLPAGEMTSELLAEVEYPVNTEEEIVPDFDVVVVQECSPVFYDTAGNPIADWNQTVINEGA